MRVQRDLAAHRGHMTQRLARHGEPVAHARRGLDDHVIGATHRDIARDQGDHPATAIASGAWLAWQIATARASAA